MSGDGSELSDMLVHARGFEFEIGQGFEAGTAAVRGDREKREEQGESAEPTVFLRCMEPLLDSTLAAGAA